MTEDHRSSRSIAEEYEITSTLIDDLLLAYQHHGALGLLPRKGKRDFSSSFKLNVLQVIREEKLSLREARIRFDLSSDAMVFDWRKKLDKFGLAGLEPRAKGSPGLDLSYIYDASGNKMKKISHGVVTDYVDGIQYTNGSIDFIQTEVGIARRNGSNYSYEYNLTDNLGNVRYTFHNNPINGQIERLQSDDYYPFGLRKSSGSPVSLNNKYLYNGKELQDELGQYDYGARFYDPVVARWNDPMAEMDRRTSPYAYGFDDPIRHTDPDGMFGEDFDDGPGDKYSNGDQKGYIRNATGYLKRTEPIKAFIADVAHDLLDGLGINSIDDKIDDLRSKPNITVKDGFDLGYKVFDAVLAISTLPEGGEGKSSGKTYQTYSKESKIGGETYSGRTSGTKTSEENIANRDKSHHMNKDFGPAKLDNPLQMATLLEGESSN